MTTALAAARDLLERKPVTGRVQVQGLLYYAQAWSLVWRGRPLFPEEIEARAAGPVIASVWSASWIDLLPRPPAEDAGSPERAGARSPDSAGSDPADSAPAESVPAGASPGRELGPEECEVIDRVHARYGPLSDAELSALIRSEAPWRNAHLDPAAGGIIRPDALARFYAAAAPASDPR